jgi:hypothetical protein
MLPQKDSLINEEGELLIHSLLFPQLHQPFLEYVLLTFRNLFSLHATNLASNVALINTTHR